jgi:hypothetical protein
LLSQFFVESLKLLNSNFLQSLMMRMLSRMLLLKLMTLPKKIKKLKKFQLNKTGLILTMSLLLQELNNMFLMVKLSNLGLTSG